MSGSATRETRALDAERLWRGFVRKVGLLLAAFYLFVFGYNYRNDTQMAEQAALEQARAHSRGILLALRWNAGHGGVYSAVDPREGDNAYSEFPDLPGADGKRYRLRHPEQMSQELADLADAEGAYQFRLVSLKPKHPQAAPDAWEARALAQLVEGRPEVHETVRREGTTEFRYMAPLRTEEACLACHSEQIHKVNQIHGGIGIRFDVSAPAQANRAHQLTMGLVLLFALGLALAGTHRTSQQLDRQLRHLDRRYEDLLHSTGSIVWEVDPANLQLTFISGQVERLLGYTPAECLGPDFWFQRIHPQDAARVWEELQAHRGTEQPLRLEFRMIDRLGHEVWMQSAMVCTGPAAAPARLRGVMLDISERKFAEQRAQDMFAEQYAILQNALVGIAYMRHGRIITCNARFEEIFGAAPAGLTGRPLRSLYPSEEAYLEIRQRVGAAFDAGKSFNTEVLLTRRDGSLFWGAMNGRRLDPADPERGAIWIYADISERKAAQTALKEHQAQLEQLVEQRTAELRRALAAARAADRAKDDFLANVSHEMRTPLNAVIGLSDLARKHTRDPQEQAYLGKVVAAGRTLLQIINDLLDLSKIASGRLDLEQIPFRLADIIDKLNALVAHRLHDQPLRFEVVRDPALPDVLVGDPLRLEQIVLNLVTNAIKFTAQGHIAVRFQRHAAAPDRLGLTIEVEDSGSGIAPEELKNLFQPFSQADHSIARTHGGTGLGLTICRRFAEMMEGNIQVVSTPGVGSTFTVRLLLREADDAAAAALATPSEAGAPTDTLQDIRYRDTRVLVVDDQEVNRQIVRELLAEVGIACDEAENGRQAVDAVLRQPAGHYALVLMDVQMPELDGYDATRALRAAPALRDLPIIAMTAFAMAHERQACLAAGMNDHLGKPFEPAYFYALLSHWIPAEHQYLASPPAPLVDPAEDTADDWPVAGIDTAAGIARFAGNRATYRRWLGIFVSEGAAPLDAVQRELGAGNRAQALRVLHAYKGRCGMLGMTALWQAIVALEAALKGERAAAEPFAQARRRLAEVLASLQDALN